MMYIIGYEINTPCPDVAVGNTIYGHLGSIEGHFQSMLIETNDSRPHCRWMFISR